MGNKSRDTKLTLNDLIAKKAAKEAAQNFSEDIYIDSLEGCITVTNPGKSAVYKCMDMMDRESTETTIYANAYLIYHAVKVFQDATLQEAYECKDPIEIVGKLLTPIEIGEVAYRITELCGFGKVDEEIKNS